MKQQAMENVLIHLRELALKHPQQLMMAITECTAMLAMNGYTAEQLAWFEVQTNGIINDYIGPTIPDVHVEKDGRIH